MNDTIAIVDVRDALHPELDRCLNGHEKGEEEPIVGQVVAEAVDEEEKDRDELCHNRALDELSEDDLGPSMSQRTVFKEQVSQPIQVLHLYVCAGQHI